MNDSRPTLDYSSPHQEANRAIDEEAARVQSVENYNEATFGEARPIAAALRRAAICLVMYLAIVWLLPQGIGRPLAWLTLVTYHVWDLKRSGWHVGRSPGCLSDW